MTHYTLKEVKDNPPALESPIADQLTPKGALGVVFGDARSGKTTWIRHRCYLVSSTLKVVFLNTADQPKAQYDSAISLGYTFNDRQLGNLNILDASGNNYSSYDSLIAELDEIHEEGDIDLLVVDEAEQFVTRYDHQGAKHYLEQHAWHLFRKLLERYGCALEAVCRTKLAEELSYYAHCVRKIYAKHSDDRMLSSALRVDLSSHHIARNNKGILQIANTRSEFPTNARLVIWQRDLSSSVSNPIYAYEIKKGKAEEVTLRVFAKGGSEVLLS